MSFNETQSRSLAERAADIKLENRVVVVTGASRGLGRAMAVGLAEAGARVVLASPEETMLHEAAEDIAISVGRGRTLVADVDITDRSACERLVEQTLGAFGALHVLVNNARRPHRGPGLPAEGNSLPFWQSDPAIWQDTVRVNVNGTFVISHVVTPHFLKQRWGRIINLTTSLGTMQGRNNSPYGVTKTALEAATLIWAQDLAGTGVTVNSLLPGGACDSDPDRPTRPGRTLLPVDVMNGLAIWLSSPLSDGKTGGRYVGRLWDPTLPPDEAARRALDEPVLRNAAADRG